MGWFTKKCPKCGGPLSQTGYSAPYPAYRCENCIALAKIKADIAALSNGQPRPTTYGGR